jgi:hypothetical protein
MHTASRDPDSDRDELLGNLLSCTTNIGLLQWKCGRLSCVLPRKPNWASATIQLDRFAA